MALPLFFKKKDFYKPKRRQSNNLIIKFGSSKDGYWRYNLCISIKEKCKGWKDKSILTIKNEDDLTRERVTKLYRRYPFLKKEILQKALKLGFLGKENIDLRCLKLLFLKVKKGKYYTIDDCPAYMIPMFKKAYKI